MKLSEIDINNLSQNQITQILFGNVKDDQKQGDCIFTFGGRGIEAVNRTRILSPCGRCRELIMLTNSQNRNTEVIISESQTVKLSDLLPYHWLEN